MTQRKYIDGPRTVWSLGKVPFPGEFLPTSCVWVWLFPHPTLCHMCQPSSRVCWSLALFVTRTLGTQLLGPRRMSCTTKPCFLPSMGPSFLLAVLPVSLEIPGHPSLLQTLQVNECQFPRRLTLTPGGLLETSWSRAFCSLFLWPGTGSSQSRKGDRKHGSVLEECKHHPGSEA